MSWIWPDYIHPGLPLSRGERVAIHRAAWRLWWSDKWNLALHLLVCAGCTVALLNAADLGGRAAGALGIGGILYKVCRAGSLLLVLISAVIIIRAVLGRCRFAPYIYEAIRRQGYDVCTKCGYWLKGLHDDVDRCPECGAERPPPLDASPQAGG
ncbi:MAG: hypothetical protein PVJ57_22090 [Phycisphaerae bacterium]|jgi:hypothetical protein